MDISGTSKAAVQQRLILTRKAVSGDNQADFCRRVRIATNTWSNYEMGRNLISREEAVKVCEATGVSLDWIYRGVQALLPMVVADKIRDIEEQEAAEKKKLDAKGKGGAA